MSFHSCILCGWKKDEKIHLFKFPKNAEIRKLWMLRAGLPETTNIRNAYLCIRHFVDSDFARPPNDPSIKRQRLKSNSVPSVFNFQAENEETLESANESEQFNKVTQSCILCGLIQNTTEKISYLRFPKNEVQRKEWVDHFQIDPSINLNNVRICSRHFSIDDNTSTHRRNKKRFAETDVDYGAMKKHVRSWNSQLPSNEGLVDQSCLEDIPLCSVHFLVDLVVPK